jgi:hypothetical protein
MFDFERHLIVVMGVAIVIIAAAVAAVLLEVPLPFLGEE